MVSSLRVCTLSDQGLDWFTRYTGAVASADMVTFERLLHPDASFQINNHMPIYGSHSIALAMSQFRASVDGMRHEFLNIYGTDMHFAAELLHHYLRKDGASVTLPVGVFIERDPVHGALISSRSHLDLTAVFA